MPVNSKSKFLFFKNRKTKSKIKASAFIRRPNYKKHTLKNKQKNFRKFGMIYFGGMDEDNVCAICLQNYSSKEILPLNCSHTFHKDCILEWARQNPGRLNCPYCRVQITTPIVQAAATRPRVAEPRDVLRLRAESRNVGRELSQDIAIQHAVDRRTATLPRSSNLNPSRQ